jgi:pimeloyl-ACP methyl ester carboxylesterase
MKVLKLSSLFIIAVISFFVFSVNLTYADQPPLNQPVGSVVSQQPMTLPSALQSIATGVRVVYVTTDLNGNKMLSSGAIITPNVHPVNANIVAWAHGTTGVGDSCAPSQNLSVFWPEAVDAVQSYLQQGWTVAATDYQGISTPGDHQYLVGKTEARSVIDSVRAARNLDSSLTTNYVITGHSQGGQAALFAGEIANSYGSGLQLKGAVGIAPASNLDSIAPQIVGTHGQGYLAFALLGLQAVDPSVHVNTILAQPALDALPVTQSDCLLETLHAYANLTSQEMVVGGQLSDSVIAKLALYGNPAQAVSSVPVLLVQGLQDATVPPAITGLLQSEECTNGVTSYVQYFNGANHNNIPTKSADFVASYIADRFNGVTPPNNCQ